MKTKEMMKRILTEIETSDRNLGVYNPKLDQFEDIDLFPKQTAKAREMLKRGGLPPELRDRQAKK